MRGGVGMEKEIKVGQSCEVAVITDTKYPYVYPNGSTGAIIDDFSKEGAIAFIGATNKNGCGNWYLPEETFKKIGKLTITKVK